MSTLHELRAAIGEHARCVSCCWIVRCVLARLDAVWQAGRADGAGGQEDKVAGIIWHLRWI